MEPLNGDIALRRIKGSYCSFDMLFSTQYVFPEGILFFLEISDLVALSRVNRLLSMDTMKERQKRKINYINQLFNFFYHPTYSVFSLRCSESVNLKKKIQHLFYFFTELCEFWAKHRIRGLEFSSRWLLFTPEEIPSCTYLSMMMNDILVFFKENTYVSYCNLEIFEELLYEDNLCKMVEGQTHFDFVPRSTPMKPPTMLYRKSSRKIE
jgi:hypothetical protein